MNLTRWVCLSPLVYDTLQAGQGFDNDTDAHCTTKHKLCINASYEQRKRKKRVFVFKTKYSIIIIGDAQFTFCSCREQLMYTSDVDKNQQQCRIYRWMFRFRYVKFPLHPHLVNSFLKYQCASLKDEFLVWVKMTEIEVQVHIHVTEMESLFHSKSNWWTKKTIK